MDLIRILKEIDSGKYVSTLELAYKLNLNMSMLEHAMLTLKNMGYLKTEENPECSADKCKYCSSLESCSAGNFINLKTYVLTEAGKETVKKRF